MTEIDPMFFGYFYNSFEDYEAGRPSNVGVTDSLGTYRGSIPAQYRFATLTAIVPEDEAAIRLCIEQGRAVIRFDFAEACEHARAARQIEASRPKKKRVRHQS